MDAYIVGVSMTPFGKHPEMSVKDLVRDAVTSALADAGIGPQQLDSAYFASATQGPLQGQTSIPGQVALRPLGIESIPVVNVENACASASTAFNLACKDIRSGDASIVLVVGADKMNLQDKIKSMRVFDGSMDVTAKQESLDRLLALSAGFEVPHDVEADVGERSVFMDVYAAMTKHHMQMFGTTQRQLAVVASKNHRHSVHNERSQFRRAFSVDEVLAARQVSWPLTLPMCSPISDGGAAAVVCSADVLQRFEKSRAVRVAASVLGTGTNREPDRVEEHVCRRVAKRAYEAAGVGPDDMSVAEVHDASAFAEIVQTENLGFCPLGEGGPLAESGATTLGGRIPVNPSGGLESKGHPISTTGLAQLFELTSQLRGDAGPRQVNGARFAIAENGGGVYGIEEATACVTILERP